MRFFLHGGSIGLAKTDLDLLRIPAGATTLTDSAAVTDFDQVSNAQLVADFDTAYSRFSAVGGIVRLDGANVTYAAEADQTAMQRGWFVGGRRVAADRSTTSPTFVDIPDFRFPVEAGKSYAFLCDGFYTSVGTTTGIGLSINGPAAGFISYGVEIATSATAWVSSGSLAYDAGLQATTGGGATPLPFHLYGNIDVTASGILVVRGKSETNGNQVTIKRGSQMLLFKVG